MEMNLCFKGCLNQNVNCRLSSLDGKLGNYQNRVKGTMQAVNFVEYIQTNPFPLVYWSTVCS